MQEITKQLVLYMISKRVHTQSPWFSNLHSGLSRTTFGSYLYSLLEMNSFLLFLAWIWPPLRFLYSAATRIPMKAYVTLLKTTLLKYFLLVLRCVDFPLVPKAVCVVLAEPFPSATASISILRLVSFHHPNLAEVRSCYLAFSFCNASGSAISACKKSWLIRSSTRL